MNQITGPGYIIYDPKNAGNPPKNCIAATGFDELYDGQEVYLTQLHRDNCFIPGKVMYIIQEMRWIFESEVSIFILDIMDDSKIWATSGCSKDAIEEMRRMMEEEDDEFGFNGDWWK